MRLYNVVRRLKVLKCENFCNVKRSAVMYAYNMYYTIITSYIELYSIIVYVTQAGVLVK